MGHLYHGKLLNNQRVFLSNHYPYLGPCFPWRELRELRGMAPANKGQKAESVNFVTKVRAAPSEETRWFNQKNIGGSLDLPSGN